MIPKDRKHEGVAAAHRLRDPGHDFQTLADSVKDYAIFTLDAGGHVMSWNTGAREIKGYGELEILGKHCSQFYPPEDREAGKPEALLETAARAGRVEDEGWRVRKDGTRFWADVVISSLHDHAGELIGFLKVTRDLTARREAEERLRQSELRLRLLVDSVKDYAIFMVDTRGQVISWNRGAERLKGYQPNEVIGKHFSIFYTAEDRAEGKPAQILALAAAEGRAEDEGWRVRQDGSVFWADVSMSAVRDERGHLLGFAKVTRDSSERRRTDRELISRSAQLSAANQELETFSYSVSHDLRAPLRGMDGFSKALLRDYSEQLPPQARNYLERIHRAAERMSELIDDLLELSRITRAEIRGEPIDLTALAHETVSDLRKINPDRNVNVTVQPGLKTSGDRRLIQAMLENLIGNAWKFTAKQPVGRIEVGAVRSHHDPEFFVRDNGVGFDMAYADKLFMPFQRLHTGTEFEGTGIGLATAYRIISRHGGRIRVESEPEKGTTFWFTLGASP
ncbi:MAG: PAS domain S-box protein [Gemmatimonadetes bacterium]|nr:PAS domain S-box protein [Gemmatimonadota bacterium]